MSSKMVVTCQPWFLWLNIKLYLIIEKSIGKHLNANCDGEIPKQDKKICKKKYIVLFVIQISETSGQFG